MAIQQTQQELDKFLKTTSGGEASAAISQFTDAFNAALRSGNIAEIERLNPEFTLFKGALTRKDQVAGFQEQNLAVVGGQVVGAAAEFTPVAGQIPAEQAIAQAIPQPTGIQETPTPTPTFTLTGENLREGSSGENVRQLQQLLGITADGIFGSKTAEAVRLFQEQSGLTVDAIVGPKTTASLAKLGTPTPPTTTEIGTGIPSADGLPQLPTTTSQQTTEAFFNSVAGDVEIARTALEATLKRQLDELNKKQEEAQKRIDEFTAQQEGVLDEADPLTQPFRETLENAERERLRINENFEANQRLVNELDSLLSEGNALIESMRGVTGLAGIRNPRTNQAIDAVNARVGVIQAVMSARSGQIAEGFRMIDRSISAINADRNDRLGYYNSLLDFYEGQKTVEGKKLITLDKEERTFLNAQIGLIENDLARSQATADFIKDAMIDPDTALAYASAGVTLNDTPQQINAKLAQYGYTQEVANLSNDMATRGWTPLISGSAPAGSTTTQTTDSQGVTKTYWKKASATTSFTGFTGSDVNQIKSDIAEFGLEKTLEGVTDPKEVKEIISISKAKVETPAPTSIEEFITVFTEVAESRKALGFTRDEFEDELKAEYGDDIPDAIKEAIEGVGTEIWGRTTLEKLLPGGR